MTAALHLVWVVGATAVAVAPNAASMPRVVGRGRGGRQVEPWYFDSFSSVALLTAEEEIALASLCRAGDALRLKREALQERLARNPTYDEWAREAGISDAATLRRQLGRASGAADRMVTANMRLVVSIARPFAMTALVRRP